MLGQRGGKFSRSRRPLPQGAEGPVEGEGAGDVPRVPLSDHCLRVTEGAPAITIRITSFSYLRGPNGETCLVSTWRRQGGVGCGTRDLSQPRIISRLCLGSICCRVQLLYFKRGRACHKPASRDRKGSSPSLETYRCVSGVSHAASLTTIYFSPPNAQRDETSLNVSGFCPQIHHPSPTPARVSPVQAPLPILSCY